MQRINKVFATLLIILISLLGVVGGSCPAPAPLDAEIVVLHTNDMHGRFVGNGEVIGIDRIAAIKKSMNNAILVDCGDTLHGLPVATLSRGADVAALMREAGYAAMAIGNHEFNYGWERLLELRDITNFPMLASNVIKNGGTLLGDTLIIEIDGVKVGFFGLTTDTAAASVMPAYREGLVFEDPISVAIEKVAYLKKNGAHVVIALAHLGEGLNKGTLSTDLAQMVLGIDVIIDGHSHHTHQIGRMENGVLIVQTGQYGANIGVVNISVQGGVIVSKTASLIDHAKAMTFKPDATVAAMLAEVTDGLGVLLDEVVGESAVVLSSARMPGVRTQEMPIGSLVADAYRAAAHADIAIVNGGDIRADIKIGSITKGDIVSVLPFGNTLMVKIVTPAELRMVLENGVSGIVADANGNIIHELSAAGRFLHVSGFSFVYDPSAPIGERIISITLDDGTELSLDDDVTALTLAGSNYVMTGGDGFIILASLPVIRELGAADEALLWHVSAHSPVLGPQLGRITVAVRAYLHTME